jgi:serine/threonine protein kinase
MNPRTLRQLFDVSATNILQALGIVGESKILHLILFWQFGYTTVEQAGMSFSLNKKTISKRADEAVSESWNLTTQPSRNDIEATLRQALKSAPNPQALKWSSSRGEAYKLQVAYKGEIPTCSLVYLDGTNAKSIWRVISDDAGQIFRMLVKHSSFVGDSGTGYGAQMFGDEADQNFLTLSPAIGTNRLFLNRYHFTKLIGRGGMGMVYKAVDRMLRKNVAVKMLHAHLLEDSTVKQRFDKEMSLCITLKHPNIVSVFDYGSPFGQVPYMVMEYLDGKSLDDLQSESGPLSVPLFISIFSQVCAALNHAHAKHYIHRDVKPGNIMLVPQERGQYLVKLVDFGIAKAVGQVQNTLQKLTNTGDALGSPFYMSPEQCRCMNLDARSDIYSLGCVMYQSISGSLPFKGVNAIATLFMHVKDSPAPFSALKNDLAIPIQLERIILKAIEKDPANRYQSIAELADELAAFANYNSTENYSLIDMAEVSKTRKTTSEGWKTSSGPASLPNEPPIFELTPNMPGLDLELLLLIMTEVVTEELAAAVTLHRSGDCKAAQFLVQLGCINRNTHQLAVKCLEMMTRCSLSIEDAALTFRYCYDRGLSFEMALAEIE